MRRCASSFAIGSSPVPSRAASSQFAQPPAVPRVLPLGCRLDARRRAGACALDHQRSRRHGYAIRSQRARGVSSGSVCAAASVSRRACPPRPRRCPPASRAAPRGSSRCRRSGRRTRGGSAPARPGCREHASLNTRSTTSGTPASSFSCMLVTCVLNARPGARGVQSDEQQRDVRGADEQRECEPGGRDGHRRAELPFRLLDDRRQLQPHHQEIPPSRISSTVRQSRRSERRWRGESISGAPAHGEAGGDRGHQSEGADLLAGSAARRTLNPDHRVDRRSFDTGADVHARVADEPDHDGRADREREVPQRRRTRPTRPPRRPGAGSRARWRR